MTSWYSTLDLDELVAALQRANFAYHNTDKCLMTDDEYDAGLEELRRRSPAHPFLKVIGASTASGVLLPVILGSQDKVRSGEGGLERWMKREGGGASQKMFVVTEKLDGLSALLVGDRMYLRGDGVRGVDVSPILKKIQGIPKLTSMVRGEILLRKEDTPEGSIGRSLVNGWVHKTPVPEELKKVRFVAYQVLEPRGLTRSQQLTWLSSRGFEVPWSIVWPRAAITDAGLKGALVSRRSTGEYPLDGLVVGADCIPSGVGGGEARNPPDSVAFKAALDEQKAETRVVTVEWNLSRQGIYVPRIQIEPVEIGGATIQWVSGHNAGLIESQKIGPGARVVVRRSGDVIPMIESVLEGGPMGVEMPAGAWEWDERRVQAVAKAVGGPVGGGEGDKALLHALQTLEVEGIGPGLVKKIVESGIDTMEKLWKATPAALSAVIGAGRGPALLEGLRAAVGRATPLQLLIASNKLPRGIGERKLRVIFEKEADPKAWQAQMFGCDTPAGWSASSLAELWAPVKEALAWSERSFPGRAVSAVEAPEAPTVSSPTKFVVFTGVRDKELESVLSSKGWAMEDSVTKKTTFVVVADGGGKESGKTKKAQALGIRIVPLSEFRGLL